MSVLQPDVKFKTNLKSTSASLEKLKNEVFAVVDAKLNELTEKQQMVVDEVKNLELITTEAIDAKKAEVLASIEVEEKELLAFFDTALDRVITVQSSFIGGDGE